MFCKAKLFSLGILFSLFLTMVSSTKAEALDSTEIAQIRQTFTTYITKIQRCESEGLGTLMHPDASAGLRDILIQVAQLYSDSSESLGILELFPELTTIEQLKSVDPGRFFETFLTNMMVESPELCEMMKHSTTTFLGVVPEGKDSCHIVARIAVDYQGVSYSHVELSSATRYEGKWLLMLSGEFKEMVESLEGMVERGRLVAPPNR